MNFYVSLWSWILSLQTEWIFFLNNCQNSRCLRYVGLNSPKWLLHQRLPTHTWILECGYIFNLLVSRQKHIIINTSTAFFSASIGSNPEASCVFKVDPAGCNASSWKWNNSVIESSWHQDQIPWNKTFLERYLQDWKTLGHWGFVAVMFLLWA